MGGISRFSFSLCVSELFFYHMDIQLYKFNACKSEMHDVIFWWTFVEI